MSRIRAFSFPRIATSTQQEENTKRCDSPTHSRTSSGTSSASSPITPTFSSRGHKRWPSSSSSVATSADSPADVTKSALHDLVEDPAEREDAMLESMPGNTDEPFCICDSPFCEHRRTASQSAVVTSSAPEWTTGDDSFSDGELPGSRSPKRRRSGERALQSFGSRLGRHWPSISTRWQDRKPSTSPSATMVHSAPPSRASSIRMPSIRRPSARHVDSVAPGTPPFTPVESQPDENELTRPRALSRPQKPADIQILGFIEEPYDRQELVSTPLLPPMMVEHWSRSTEDLQSPLQSPTLAEPSSTGSLLGTSSMTHGGMPTPPLSSKPSFASSNVAKSALALHPTSEIPPMDIGEATDPWAMKLGHANFHILPEPYLPPICNMQTCKNLLNDWESACMEYMRQAARISDHYGPTSQTYKFTEQKWAEIDQEWRMYHEQANAEAGTTSDDIRYQPLAEMQPLSKMPSLNDPEQPTKFPKIDEGEIVGPMVQYAKVQRRPSRKPAFLKLFTDPALLLGGRSAFSPRR